jgi:hypothetical protein
MTAIAVAVKLVAGEFQIAETFERLCMLPFHRQSVTGSIRLGSLPVLDELTARPTR